MGTPRSFGLFSHQIGTTIAVCTIENVTSQTNGTRRPAAVITVSDGCARGKRKDLSGPAVASELELAGFEVMVRVTVPDEPADLEDALRRAAQEARLIVTTGGTGIGPRDITPEATRAVCDRLIEGIPELMRREGLRETPMAVLSRGLCGTISAPQGGALVLNLPGSPAGAVSSLRAALPVLPHALDLLAGKTEHVQEHRQEHGQEPVQDAPAASSGSSKPVEG